MELPLVSLGRFRDMRERAYRAEKQVDDLLDMLESERSNTVRHTGPTSQPVQLKETGAERQEIEDVTVPPMVEHAIRKRARSGSPLEAQLLDEARSAIEALGADFDESSYAKQIIEGTRIEGWPV